MDPNRILTVTEIDLLKRHLADDPEWSLIFDLLLYYFMSPEDICRLRRSDVHLDTSSPFLTLIRQPPEATVELPILPLLHDRLGAQLASTDLLDPSAPLFSRSERQGLDETRINEKLHELCAWAGLSAPSSYRINDEGFRPDHIAYIGQSPFQVISVLDVNTTRYVFTDHAISGVLRLDTNALIFQKHLMFVRLIELLDFHPARILILGGGVYVIPRYLAQLYPTARIEVVEIDPEITRVAEDYFHLRPSPRLTIHHQDAFHFVQGHEGPYDLVFFDIVVPSTADEPSPLTRPETLERYRDLLNPEGMFIFNALGFLDGPKSGQLKGWLDRLSSLYPHRYIFGTEGPNSEARLASQNIVVLNLKGERFVDVETLKAGAGARRIEPAFFDHLISAE